MDDTVVLSLARAGFAFHGSETQTLAEIDLRIGPGEMIAVLGPQGSGTSTLCRLAAGLLGDRGAVSGAITVRGSVAMLGDDPEAQLTGMTSYVDDEVSLPARLAGSTRPVDIGAVLDTFGMQRLLGRRLDTLSGGERQLVALASLMTGEPALLVLDQPALSLDPDARMLLVRALRSFCDAGGSVLLTGHQHDDLTAAADRVAFVRGGRLVGSARPAELTDEALGVRGVWNTLSDAAHLLAPPLPGAHVNASEALLDVRGLSVRRATTEIFPPLDVRAAPGEVAAIVGPNGSGKSTLLRAVAGLLEVDATAGTAGSVRVGGTELVRMPAHQRTRWLGWVGQDPGAQLSAATAQTELERALPLPPHRRRDRARLREERATDVAGVLAQTGLVEQAAEHPYDLAPAQRKDLVIASALLLRPDVVLLDEPTLGRDFAGMRRLERVIRDFTASGGAVVVTTHDLRWADRIAARVVRLR